MCLDFILVLHLETSLKKARETPSLFSVQLKNIYTFWQYCPQERVNSFVLMILSQQHYLNVDIVLHRCLPCYNSHDWLGVKNQIAFFLTSQFQTFLKLRFQRFATTLSCCLQRRMQSENKKQLSPQEIRTAFWCRDMQTQSAKCLVFPLSILSFCVCRRMQMDLQAMTRVLRESEPFCWEGGSVEGVCVRVCMRAYRDYVCACVHAHMCDYVCVSLKVRCSTSSYH